MNKPANVKVNVKALFVAVVAVSAVAVGQVASPRGQAAPSLQRVEPSAVAGGPRSGDSTSQAFQRAGGSLFHMTSNTAEGGEPEPSLFAVPKPDPKRIKKHDLITVIVRESSDSQTSASTDTKKSTDFNAILQQYLQLQDFAVRTKTPQTPPQLRFAADRKFKGEGTVDRSDSMTARIQAEVVDVKPNGTLRIQAIKQIKMDEEELKMTLTGNVRAEDITIDNSVLSSQIADLQLAKTTKGAARDASKRGWVVKFFDAINPF